MIHKPGRRLFLKKASTAGAALAVTGRAMASEAMQKASMQQAGIASMGYNASAGLMPQAGNSSRVLELMKLVGIPAWKKRELRHHAKYSARTIDPDIAEMRSLSLSAKVRLQAERNYERAERDFFTSLLQNKERDAFNALNGVDIW